ncbi:MAG: hypothetical protein Kow0010_09930 [Dehalococcoidia bacterium]
MARPLSLARRLGFPRAGAIVRLVPRDTDTFDIVRLRDVATIGAIELEPLPGNVLFVRSLCIGEPYRSYGAGSEAARMLVESAASAGFKALRAWADPNLGLSVYFWIRMGLRPLHGPGPGGGIWFERRLL